MTYNLNPGYIGLVRKIDAPPVAGVGPDLEQSHVGHQSRHQDRADGREGGQSPWTGPGHGRRPGGPTPPRI